MFKLIGIQKASFLKCYCLTDWKNLLFVNCFETRSTMILKDVLKKKEITSFDWRTPNGCIFKPYSRL